MKKIALVVIAVVNVLLLIYLVNPVVNRRANFGAAVAEVDEAISVITHKMSRERIESRFDPVLIYKLLGDEIGSFAGCGSLFYGSNGKQILTVEHLFPASNGKHVYAYRLLRSADVSGVYGIEEILHTGQEVAGGPSDVVILKTGIPRMITGFSIHNLEPKYEVNHIMTPITNYWITSLVSGERVRVFAGVRTSKDQMGFDYVLLDYVSTPGESGTGFITDEDSIFVLKGHVVMSEKSEDAVRAQYGQLRGITMAYGPLQLQ